MSDQPYDDVREAFTEADLRFKESMSSAFVAHTKCVASFFATLARVEQRELQTQTAIRDLRETVAQVQALVMEQGQELRALRGRLNGGSEG